MAPVSTMSEQPSSRAGVGAHSEGSVQLRVGISLGTLSSEWEYHQECSAQRGNHTGNAQHRVGILLGMLSTERSHRECSAPEATRAGAHHGHRGSFPAQHRHPGARCFQGKKSNQPYTAGSQNSLQGPGVSSWQNTHTHEAFISLEQQSL